MDSDSAKPAYLWLVIGVLAALLAALSVVSLVRWRQKEELRRAAAPSQNLLPPNEDVLWSRMFAPDQDTSIVVSDTTLGLVEALVEAEVSLDDYSGGAFADKMIESVPDRTAQMALRAIAAGQLTSLADVNMTVRLMEMCRRYNGRCRVRYSRYLDPREFKTGNFILIGSRPVIPWDGLFEPQLNFYLEQDRKTHRYRIGNRSPLPGEQGYYGIRNTSPFAGGDYYAGIPNDKQVEVSYGYLALLPNLTGTGYVLIISGLMMSDTEATGELITGPGFATTLSKILRSKAGKPPAPYVEVLLQSNVMDGTTRGSKIVAYRLITP